MDPTLIPTHVGLIADGNRRWAKQHGKSPIEGHNAGSQTVEQLTFAARELGVKVFSVWGFSTENWGRAQEEVGLLMKLFEKVVVNYLDKAMKEKMRIIHLGRKDRFSAQLRSKIIQAEEQTKNFTDFTLCAALDYGGADEVERASAEAAKLGGALRDHLDTSKHCLPDFDLVIRTGGAQRTSGFFPLQTAYAEWYFCDKLLPDFTPDDLQGAIEDYATRQRRFGK